MSALGLKIIDESVQQANIWFNEVDYRTGWDNKQRSYRLLRAVLHALRDHMNADEAAQLSAQLPILIRGIYYEGYDPSKTPVTERSRRGFRGAGAVGLHDRPDWAMPRRPSARSSTYSTPTCRAARWPMSGAPSQRISAGSSSSGPERGGRGIGLSRRGAAPPRLISLRRSLERRGSDFAFSATASAVMPKCS
jgi:hypothetical protein